MSLASPPRFNEKDLLVQFAIRLAEIGSFIDIGAHIGSFSAAFGELGWRVTAVEAAPKIYAELTRRMAQFPNVEPIHAAATEDGGADVEFFISSEYWGIHSLRPFDESHDTSVRVRSMTLAEIIGEGRSREPLVVKVDAEGADLMVLRGADWQAPLPVLVMCEFMDSRTVEHFGYGYQDTVAFMERLGYVTYISEWAEVEEHSRRGSGGGPFTHVQVLTSPLFHEPAWGNLIFVLPHLQESFEQTLTEYLVEITRRADLDLSELAEMKDQLTHSRETVSNRERKIMGLEGLVSRRDGRIEELTNAVRQRDNRIRELTSAVQQRDNRTEVLTDAVRQRDEAIEQIDANLAETRQSLLQAKRLGLALGITALALLAVVVVLSLSGLVG